MNHSVIPLAAFVAALVFVALALLAYWMYLIWRTSQQRQGQQSRVAQTAPVTERVGLQQVVDVVPRRALAIDKAKARSGRSSATRVEASRHPLWMIRGWRPRGKELVGAYRTPHGSFSGVIEINGRGEARSYFILNPPESLLTGSHGPCFRPRGRGRYWVHFTRSHPDVDAGLVAVENLLTRALTS